MARQHDRATLAIVRILLAAYPAAFRNSFAAEIEEVVRRQCEERGDRRAQRRLLVHTALDLARHAAAQRAGQVLDVLAAARASRVRVKIEAWAEVWTLVTSCIVWVAFVATLGASSFEWGLFGASGSGLDGFVALLSITFFAVCLPLANAFCSPRIRSGLQAVWLAFWTLKIIEAVIHAGPEAALQLDSWGFRISLAWLVIPSVVFTGNAVVGLIAPLPKSGGSWSQKARAYGLAGAIALVPLQMASFARSGADPADQRFAIALTVIQWIVLWQVASQPPRPRRPERQQRRPSVRVDPNSPLFSEVSK